MLGLFIALWSQDPIKYEPAAKKCAEALYTTGDLKQATDKIEKMTREAVGPIITSLTVAGYAAGVKHEIKLSSSRLSPINNSVVVLNLNKTIGSVNLTWGIN